MEHSTLEALFEEGRGNRFETRRKRDAEMQDADEGWGEEEEEEDGKEQRREKREGNVVTVVVHPGRILCGRMCI